LIGDAAVKATRAVVSNAVGSILEA
jgi:hypothetical protein